MFTAILLIMSPNWEQPPCHSRGKQTVLCSCNGLCLGNKKQQNTNAGNSLDEVSRKSRWMEKAVSKGNILYGSIFMTFSERQNYRTGEQISGCQGLGEGGCNCKGDSMGDSGGWQSCPMLWWQLLKPILVFKSRELGLPADPVAKTDSMLPVREILHAVTKTRHSQTNKYSLKYPENHKPKAKSILLFI